MTRDNRDVWLNVVWFYLVWFAAVVGQEAFLPVTVSLIFIHLFLHRRNPKELLLIACVAITGIAVDSGLAVSGLLVFPTQWLIPWWLMALWVGFACTLKHSLRFLSRHWLVAASIGGVGGSSSYFAGYKLGAVGFGFNLYFSLGALAIIWSCLLPLFFLMDRVIERRF